MSRLDVKTWGYVAVSGFALVASAFYFQNSFTMPSKAPGTQVQVSEVSSVKGSVIRLGSTVNETLDVGVGLRDGDSIFTPDSANVIFTDKINGTKIEVFQNSAIRVLLVESGGKDNLQLRLDRGSVYVSMPASCSLCGSISVRTDKRSKNVKSGIPQTFTRNKRGGVSIAPKRVEPENDSEEIRSVELQRTKQKVLKAPNNLSYSLMTDAPKDVFLKDSLRFPIERLPKVTGKAKLELYAVDRDSLLPPVRLGEYPARSPFVNFGLGKMAGFSVIETDKSVERYEIKLIAEVNEGDVQVASSVEDLEIVSLAAFKAPTTFAMDRLQRTTRRGNFFPEKPTLSSKTARYKVTLYSNQDFANFGSLLRGANRLSWNVAKPSTGAGSFIVKSGKIIGEIEGDFSSVDLLQIRTALGADFVFKGRKNSLVSQSMMSRSRKLYRRLKSGRKFYIHQNGQLRELTPARVRSEADIAKIATSRSGLFRSAVQILR